ncbi:MAG: hypothetical protein K0U78_20995 [Actinomycetia bacterium]|nr:hypothetical protein [Actinomycetes bacterium]
MTSVSEDVPETAKTTAVPLLTTERACKTWSVPNRISKRMQTTITIVVSAGRVTDIIFQLSFSISFRSECALNENCDGWMSDDCTTCTDLCVDDNPCQNNGTCSMTGTYTYICDCENSTFFGLNCSGDTTRFVSFPHFIGFFICRMWSSMQFQSLSFRHVFPLCRFLHEMSNVQRKR